MHHLIANWIYIIAGLAFAAFLGCLIGHSIRERRHAAQLADTRGYWKQRYDDSEAACNDSHVARKQWETCANHLQKDLDEAKAFIESLREQNRRLEQSVDVQTRAKNEKHPYMDAIKHALTLAHLSDEGTAMDQLYRLLAWESAVALDPAVSKQAKNLITKGVRKANKLNRARLAKIVEEYERKCQALVASGRAYEHACHNHHNELQLHREALRVTMKDKIGLVGVRRAFHKAFIANIAQLRIQQVTK